MTGQRDVRDRLAEALWWQHTQGAGSRNWSGVSAEVREYVWYPDADSLLRALPTVGLRIGRVEE